MTRSKSKRSPKTTRAPRTAPVMFPMNADVCVMAIRLEQAEAVQS